MTDEEFLNELYQEWYEKYEPVIMDDGTETLNYHEDNMEMLSAS